jgi:hypothetical protein
MKVLATVGTVTLFLLFGMAVPALAQGDHQDEGAKPAQHDEQAKPAKQERQAKPAQRQEQAKSTKQGDQRQAENQQRQTRSNNQQEAKATKPEVRQQAGNRQPQRSAAEQQRQRSQPELRLSARGEGRIPDDRFRSHFGHGHEFRIGSPKIVDGYSRFQYGGYWFGFVQPWPVEWYYTDDVYVDYINGEYYLCNPSYPGTQIAIVVL